MAAALLAVAQGVGHAMSSSAPEMVARVAPWFARAHGRQAEFAVVAGDVAKATREAKIALHRDVTLVSAVRTLGQVDDGPHGAQLLGQALSLSRRDFPTHMALIVRAAAAGDLATVMSHYNQALRTSRSSWSILLPPLAQAAAAPALIEPLARELAKRPQWLFFFYREWVKSSPNTATMVALSREMERRGQPLNREVRSGLLSRLVQAADWDSLRDELSRARPACGADHCIDGEFRRYDILQPVDWSASASDHALVIRTPLAGKTYALDYSFTGPGEALVARRLMLLPPGQYIFDYVVESAGIGQATGTVGLALECADASGAVLSEPSLSRGTLRRSLASVPLSCPAQWATFRVVSDSSNPVSGRIARVGLTAPRSDAR